MKLILATATAALIGTVALADQSTRYYDMRLDTSKTADQVYSDEVRPTDLDAAQRGRDSLMYSTADQDQTPDATMSTRSDIRTQGEGFIYGGYGPGNDSR